MPANDGHGDAGLRLDPAGPARAYGLVVVVEGRRRLVGRRSGQPMRTPAASPASRPKASGVIRNTVQASMALAPILK